VPNEIVMQIVEHSDRLTVKICILCEQLICIYSKKSSDTMLDLKMPPRAILETLVKSKSME
jgi:hypothetical protein